MKHIGKAVLSIVIASGLVLSACSSMVDVTSAGGETDGDGAQKASFTQFPDIPIPIRAEIDMDKSLVLGGGDAWIGRLVMTTGYGAYDMFDFFKKKLPEFGWAEFTSVRASTSVLTYTRQNRVATIQIVSNTLRGSESTVTVSPRDAAQQP